MKKSIAALGLAAALLFGGTRADAAIGTLDNVPAATLLLPYFETGTTASGPRTTLTVGNRGAADTLAHVTLWTDAGVPTARFDVRIPGKGTTEIDLTEIFTSGALPQSTAGGFASCTATLPPAPVDATALRNAHSGAASALLGGMCGSSPHGDTLARGYVTIDATSACTALAPGDAGYFVTGGAGVATNNNVLWGEVAKFQANNFAAGDALVALEASGSNALTTGTSYTFYGRRNGGNSADNREKLPSVYMGRYQMQDVLFRTTAEIWRDPGQVSAFACGSPPAGISSRQVLVFDDKEEPSLDAEGTHPRLAAQSVRLDDPAQSSVPFTLGFIYYNLGLAGAVAPYGTENQAHVSLVYRALTGGESKAAGWTGLGLSAQDLPIQVRECSDGIDNDGDGLIDFPNDPGCRNADDFSESPQCSDGIDNDGDGLIDYPADPECTSPHDQSEGFSAQCDDNIDNDGDGLVDYPDDPQCNFPNDNTENFGQCDNGIDDDGDGLIDYPADPGCTSRSDPSETQPACSDGIDNDGDGLIDAADPGCSGPNSNNEAPACNDGVDNDGDGQIDYPADLSCPSASGTSETSQCSDGVDNDGDGLIDYPADPTCTSLYDNAEQTQCSDGFDNDGDGLIDYPNDPGCTALNDTSEVNSPQCSDGIDNDGNGTFDFPNDPGCTTASDNFEGPDCSDGQDNDLDGLVDAADPGCASPTDTNELSNALTRSCSDGLDNDGDGQTDYPADTGCQSRWDDVEYTPGPLGSAVVVQPATLPGGTVNVAYSQVISATGGLSPYTFAVTAGTLPAGLALDPVTGALTGSPTAIGSSSFTVTATDTNGFTGARAYTLVIAGAQARTPVPALSPAGLALLMLALGFAAWFARRRPA